ncbi:MAG: Uncharacterized protein FD189_1692 [Elusimicrobia bacterium]|nr:MAG: Uncharacterized protein FD154_1858 [Elusimicrobiota bacterium]KAF0154812.1 MAG: Uncharacterized protein FD189_1692 [Elusimicrobiota bacterium]
MTMPVSAYFIIAANLLPLGLVLTGDWGLREILPLYWVESAIIGFFTILKMLLAGGPVGKLRVGKPAAGPEPGAGARLAFSALIMGGKLFMAAFFTFHFGMFMVVHGVFLFGFVLQGAQFGPAKVDPMNAGLWLEYLGAVKWGIAALFGGHAASFFLNYLAGGEYRHASAGECMAQPYPRVVVMHLTILLGAFASMAMPGAGTIMVIFVVAKILADVSAHKKEHVKAAAKGAAAEQGAAPGQGEAAA